MFAPDDTIVAVATPSGRGGLGVVRLSGPHAASLARHLLDHSGPLLARHATVSRIVDAGGPSVEAFDRVVATFFPRPGSYTGDDVVYDTRVGTNENLRSSAHCDGDPLDSDRYPLVWPA